MRDLERPWLVGGGLARAHRLRKAEQKIRARSSDHATTDSPTATGWTSKATTRAVPGLQPASREGTSRGPGIVGPYGGAGFARVGSRSEDSRPEECFQNMRNKGPAQCAARFGSGSV